MKCTQKPHCFFMSLFYPKSFLPSPESCYFCFCNPAYIPTKLLSSFFSNNMLRSTVSVSFKGKKHPSQQRPSSTSMLFFKKISSSVSFGIKIIQTPRIFKVCFCISDVASMMPQSLIMLKHRYYFIKCALLMLRHNRRVRTKQTQLVMFVHLLTRSAHLLFCSFELSPRVREGMTIE